MSSWPASSPHHQPPPPPEPLTWRDGLVLVPLVLATVLSLFVGWWLLGIVLFSYFLIAAFFVVVALMCSGSW